MEKSKIARQRARAELIKIKTCSMLFNRTDIDMPATIFNVHLFASGDRLKKKE